MFTNNRERTLSRGGAAAAFHLRGKGANGFNGEKDGRYVRAGG